jgi:hypothetical protein
VAVRINGNTSNYLSRALATDFNGVGSLSLWGKISVDRDDWSTFVGVASAKALETNSTGTTLTFYDGAQNGSYALTVGTWYHLAIVQVTATGFTWYVNGVSQGTNASGWNQWTTLQLGRNENYGEPLNGCIAHVKIWNQALGAAEIAQEMYTARPQQITGLWAWWPLFAHTDLVDYSGNGRALTGNGTLTTEDGPPVSWGAPVWVVPFVAAGGGTAYDGSASLATAAAVAPTARLDAATTLALAGAAALTPAATQSAGLSLALAQTAGASAAGTLAAQGSVTLPVTVSVLPAGVQGARGSLPLGAAAESVTAALHSANVMLALSAAAQMVAAAQTQFVAALALSGAATVTLGGAVTGGAQSYEVTLSLPAAAALIASGALALGGGLTLAQTAQVAQAAQGALPATLALAAAGMVGPGGALCRAQVCARSICAPGRNRRELTKLA